MNTAYILSWREEDPYSYIQEEYATFEERKKTYDELLKNEHVKEISVYKIVIEEEIER